MAAGDYTKTENTKKQPAKSNIKKRSKRSSIGVKTLNSFLIRGRRYHMSPSFVRFEPNGGPGIATTKVTKVWCYVTSASHERAKQSE